MDSFDILMQLVPIDNNLFILLCCRNLVLPNGKRKKLNWTGEEVEMLKVFVCVSLPAFLEMISSFEIVPSNPCREYVDA